MVSNILSEMKNLLSILKFFALSVMVFALVSCEEKPEDGALDVQLDIPSIIEVGTDGLVQFRIMFSKAPQKTDIVVLGDSSGKEHDCEIVNVSTKNITVALFKGYFADTYTVSVRRGKAVKQQGKTTLVISDGVEPAEGSTVYGRVMCEDKPLKGVVISDGVEVVATDDNEIGRAHV